MEYRVPPVLGFRQVVGVQDGIACCDVIISILLPFFNIRSFGDPNIFKIAQKNPLA